MAVRRAKAYCLLLLLVLLACTLQNPSPAQAADPSFLTYQRDGFLPVQVEERLRPWQRVALSSTLKPTLDDEGVAIVRRPDGKVYDHPVRQAQWGLRCIRTWRVTGDAGDLEAARAQADRLIERRVEARGAWWFPYRFAFSIPVERVDLEPPWYSGMSQGEALGLFSQLAQILADSDPAAAMTYREAAEKAFTSLRLGPEEQPWVSMTDGKGYLWIQEYPQDPPPESDYTYNGFAFAALGIWDYWHLTGSQDAEALFDGAVSTLVHTFPSFRRPAWMSIYGLRGDRPHPTYHLVHTTQLLELSWLTGSGELADLSDTLQEDFPAPLQSGSVLLSKGAHTLVKYDDRGAITETRSVTLQSASSAPAVRRARIFGRGGYHYRISKGLASGWWVQASSRARMAGIRLLREYHPTRPIQFTAGKTYALPTYDTQGRQTSTTTFTPSRNSLVRHDQRAVINGSVMVRISSGSFKGRWAVLSLVRPRT